MSRPASCYDAQRDAKHVDEAVLSSKDYISERVVTALPKAVVVVLFISKVFASIKVSSQLIGQYVLCLLHKT